VLTCGAEPALLDEWVNALVPAAARAGTALVVVSPPLSRSGVGVTVARACSESVVVAEPDRSRVGDVDVTLRILRASGVSVSGIVLSRSPLAGAVRAPAVVTDPGRPGPSGAAQTAPPSQAASAPAGVGAPGSGRRDVRVPGDTVVDPPSGHEPGPVATPSRDRHSTHLHSGPG
jgi:hypothetical protein